MELEVTGDADGRLAQAVTAAATGAGVGLAGDRPPSGSAWWRDGVGEAHERTPLGAGPSRYEAARSPRSTRGATRA
jgi:hypothetical protein